MKSRLHWMVLMAACLSGCVAQVGAPEGTSQAALGNAPAQADNNGSADNGSNGGTDLKPPNAPKDVTALTGHTNPGGSVQSGENEAPGSPVPWHADQQNNQMK